MYAIDRLERAVRSRLPNPSAEIQATLTPETKFAQLREQLDYLAITNRPDKSKPPHWSPKEAPKPTIRPPIAPPSTGHRSRAPKDQRRWCWCRPRNPDACYASSVLR